MCEVYTQVCISKLLLTHLLPRVKQNVHVAVCIDLDEQIEGENNILNKWSELFEHATVIHIPDWSDKDRMQLAKHILQPLRSSEVGSVKLCKELYSETA